MKGHKMEILDVETVTAQRVIPFWYRGSLDIDPLKANGKQTLEQDIREFERWQRARSSEAQN